jgi:hypothetical protein
MTEPIPTTPPSQSADRPSHQDALASLKFYVDLANSERQTIWTRHATMLVGNSLIVNAARSGGGDALFLNLAGLLLCLVWLVMICDGYRWFWKAMADSKNLGLGNPLNPFSGIDDIWAFWKDWLFLSAWAVVLIFGAVYVHGLWPTIKSLWPTIKSVACGN